MDITDKESEFFKSQVNDGEIVFIHRLENYNYNKDCKSDSEDSSIDEEESFDDQSLLALLDTLSL